MTQAQFNSVMTAANSGEVAVKNISLSSGRSFTLATDAFFDENNIKSSGVSYMIDVDTASQDGIIVIRDTFKGEFGRLTFYIDLAHVATVETIKPRRRPGKVNVHRLQ